MNSYSPGRQIWQMMKEVLTFEPKIQSENYVDELTKLPSRRAVKQHLHALASSVGQARIFVLVINIDNFSDLNTALNYEAGSTALIEISRRIRRHLHQSIFFGRLGGDEFTAVGRGIHDESQVIQLLHELLNIIKNPIVIDGHTIELSASIGAAISPGAGETAPELMRNAGIALSRAKKWGKRQWQLYHSEMDIETYRRFLLKNDLIKALHEKAFVVYYQPKVDPVMNRIVGAEALLRWQHNEWGLVPPSEFITLAEEVGMLSDIEDWVIETVCAQNKQWQDAGLQAIPVSVNISAQHLLDVHFVSRIKRMLEQTGLQDAESLEIEITETSVMLDDQSAAKTIEALHQLGVKTSIDDFGTGYSSLSRLKSCAFHTVKIDKTFIDDIEHYANGQKLLESMIHMAHVLGMKVVAEGVETLQQLDFLRKHECDEIQGFYYSPPVPAHDFLQLVQGVRPLGYKEIASSEDRRRFDRYELPYPIIAQMTIHQIHERRVSIGDTTILIADVGSGGLRFFSHLRLPEEPAFKFMFRFTLIKDLQVQGTIAWSRVLGEKLYEYGVEFLADDSVRRHLQHDLKLLQQPDVKTRLLSSTRTYSESPRQFFSQVTRDKYPT